MNKLMTLILVIISLGCFTVNAQSTDAALTTQAQVIRDETSPGGNTRERIYSMYKGLIDSKPSLLGSYSNPSWITGLAWSKISGTPTTLAGYGIVDAPSALTFTAADFNVSGVNVSLDYVNGQEATSGVKGFLKAGDWSTFNNKQDALTFTASDFDESLGTISIDFANGQAASVSAKGYLTAADWATFNSKQAALSAASGSTSGYLTSTDWNTFNGKQDALTFTAADFNLSGSTLSIDYTNGQAAASGVKGFLTATDWATFNGKQAALTPAALTRVNDTNVTATLSETPLTALLQPVTVTLGWTGTLAYSRFVNGAGLSVVGRSANTTGVQADITAGSDGNILRRLGTTIGFGSIDLASSGAVGTTVLDETNGGTGNASYTTGDLLSASGSTTLGKIAAVGAGSYLRSAGSSTLPVWSTMTLPNTITSGNVLYATGTNVVGSSTSLKFDGTKLLVGPSSALTVGQTSARFQVAGLSGDDASVSIRRFINTTGIPVFSFGKSRGATIDASGIIQNGDGGGVIDWAVDDGTDMVSRIAAIHAFVDGAPGANDTPGRLEFQTTSDGSASPTTRMTISSDGTVTATNVVVSTLLTATTTMKVGGNATASGYIDLAEDSDNGSNRVRLQAPASTADQSYVLPTAVPAGDGYVLSSTTAGVMSWGQPVIPLSSITGATTSGSVDHGNNGIQWTWDGAASGYFSLASASTALPNIGISELFGASISGANANSNVVSGAAAFVNSHSGTGSINYGVRAAASGGSQNYALFVDAGDVKLDEASNFNLGTTTGTKIGTSTSQKLAFWNATPIVQITTSVTAATFTANAGTAVNDASTFDGYTLKQVVKALRNLGLLQ